MANNRKMVIARQQRKALDDGNHTSKCWSHSSPKKTVVASNAKVPSCSSPRKAVAASNTNPTIDSMSLLSPQKGKGSDNALPVSK
jgi:hypothetical protein